MSSLIPVLFWEILFGFERQHTISTKTDVPECGLETIVCPSTFSMMVIKIEMSTRRDQGQGGLVASFLVRSVISQVSRLRSGLVEKLGTAI